MSTTWNAEIIEQGNGLPDRGLYVAGDDGNLYQIVEIDNNINTGRRPGQGNWSRAEVIPADWDDIESDDEVFPALALVGADE
jgi:hypothetical protein